MQLFIKFGAEEHLKQLQKDGILYCKSVLEFAKMENDEARSDQFENVIKLELLNDKIVWLKEKNNENAEWKRLNVNYGQFKLSDEKYKGNLFCMSSFPLISETTEFEIILDKRFLEKFGTHYLLVLNQPEFFKRIDKELRGNNIDYVRGEVEYKDLKRHSGNKTIFDKDLFFSWQNEYRFFIKTDATEFKIFNIGSIEDITEVGQLTESTSFKIRKGTSLNEL